MSDLETLEVNQLGPHRFEVTIDDKELEYTGEPRLFAIGHVSELVSLLERVKWRRKHDGRDLILELSELGRWIGDLPKRTKVIHTRLFMVSDSAGELGCRIGFSIRFLDPKYAVMFKLKFC